jgi:hypothetical protein
MAGVSLARLDPGGWSRHMRAPLVPAAVLAASVCASAQEGVQAPPAPPACVLSAADRAWIERSLTAWRFATHEIAGIERMPSYRAIFFDARCVLTSDDALTRADAQGVTWSVAPHAGTITVPDGTEIPVGVTSFASGKDGTYWFVMSTPSVWEAGGLGQGPDLESTMVAVLLHEASHVAQLGPYGPRLGALIERNSLPDSFDDDALQDRFRSNNEFAASVARETAMFLQAAAEPDDERAQLLAFEARELMRERAARWLVGADAYLAAAEDIWLTFEGSGQWVAYRWQIHPRGGARATADVLPGYARDHAWAQSEGFAVVMALDRVAGPGWKLHAFGDGKQTVLEMLDAALSER